MKNSINFNQFSLQVKAGLISYVISWSCIISKETSAKVYFSFWMKGAKTNIRDGARERNVHHLHLHLGVTNRNGGVEEGARGRWGSAKLRHSHSPPGVKKPRLLRYSSVPSRLFYIVLSNFSPMSCCAIAQAPLPTISLQSQLSIQILTPSFSSQTYW